MSGPDQSLLNEKQDELMMRLSLAWNDVRETRDPKAMVEAVRAAAAALDSGGVWPDDRWVENILMMGGNSAYHAVLGHDLFPEIRDEIGRLQQENVRRRWIKGAPSGTFDADDSMRLGQAAAYWQKHPREDNSAASEPAAQTPSFQQLLEQRAAEGQRPPRESGIASKARGLFGRKKASPDKKALQAIAAVIGTSAGRTLTGDMPSDYLEFTIDNQRLEFHRLVKLVAEQEGFHDARDTALKSARASASTYGGDAATAATHAVEGLLAEIG